MPCLEREDPLKRVTSTPSCSPNMLVYILEESQTAPDKEMIRVQVGKTFPSGAQVLWGAGGKPGTPAAPRERGRVQLLRYPAAADGCSWRNCSPCNCSPCWTRIILRDGSLWGGSQWGRERVWKGRNSREDLLWGWVILSLFLTIQHYLNWQ